MKIEELNKILDEHRKWLETDGDSGERAHLQGADLPEGFYQAVGAGSSQRCTTYDSINNQVICGCWDDENGNSLESLKERVESIYGEQGEIPNAKYYTEYMAAIAFFEKVRSLN